MIKIWMLSIAAAVCMGVIIGGLITHKILEHATYYRRVEDRVVVLPEEYKAITKDTLIAKVSHDTIYLGFTGKHKPK